MHGDSTFVQNPRVPFLFAREPVVSLVYARGNADLSIITFCTVVRLFVNPSLRHFELVPDPTCVELGSWALRGWLLCRYRGK